MSNSAVIAEVYFMTRKQWQKLWHFYGTDFGIRSSSLELVQYIGLRFSSPLAAGFIRLLFFNGKNTEQTECMILGYHV